MIDLWSAEIDTVEWYQIEWFDNMGLYETGLIISFGDENFFEEEYV